MRSSLPKVLHPLAGRPLLAHVLAAAAPLGSGGTVVVLGHAGERVREQIPADAAVAWQPEPLGTGDAVRYGLAALPAAADALLVVYGDTALVRTATLRTLIDALGAAPAALLTARLDDPRGYGRVLRTPGGAIERLIEERELANDGRDLQEVVGGALAFRAGWLRERLPRLPRHANGEYYLTDLITWASEEGTPATALPAEDAAEALGINDRLQLAEAHRVVYERVRRSLLLDVGVSMPQPETVFVEPGVEVGQDTVLLPHTHLRGRTRVGAACVLGPGTELLDTSLGDRCRVSWSVLEGSSVGDEVQIGPYCHLRRGTRLDDGVKLGNFVEVKNSRVGQGTHAGHFSYIGDADLGRQVNVGAGTVTCNYDGARKHRTVIEDDVFVGSDTLLIAPIRLGSGSRTGAGSVVTRDVKPGQLVVGAPARPVPPRGPSEEEPERSPTDGTAAP